MIETYSSELVMTKWSSSRSWMTTPLEWQSLRHSITCFIILAASISGRGPFLATKSASDPGERGWLGFIVTLLSLLLSLFINLANIQFL